ncbi:MAG: sigma-70 family RNA polymerase sigma factor [Verrucomicrobiaceae bacterium]|nr:sigma-70 family RNA polymerase sigma factor [Verrucomicrobiaceae bacterium]
MTTDTQSILHHRHQGDANAFRTLVQLHAGMVYATARRVTQDAALAQDVAQETFLALLKKGDRRIQSVPAWLHHVAWQKACDLVRRESRRRHYEALAVEQTADANEATWEQIEPLLDEALSEMDEASRSLIIARYLCGRTQEQIAREQGLSQATISRSLNSSLDQLRERLRAKGVAAGAGMATLLGVHALEAAPAAVGSILGKLGLSGAGAAAGMSWFSTMASALTSKAGVLAFSIGGAVIAVSAVGYQLAAPNETAVPPAGTEPIVAPTAGAAPFQALATPARVRTNNSMSTSGPSVAAARGPGSPDAGQVAKLVRFADPANFRALMLRLQASKDRDWVRSELAREMGLAVSDEEARQMLGYPGAMLVGVARLMASRHPQETLLWLAQLSQPDRTLIYSALPVLLKQHPHLTAEVMAPLLPQGPGRERLLSVLRGHQDALGEMQAIAALNLKPYDKMDRYLMLAEMVKPEQRQAVMQWALRNLSAQDQAMIVPRVLHHVAQGSSSDALATLAQISDNALRSKSLIECLHGLVVQSRHVGEVLKVIDGLQGQPRAEAINELGRRWVRVDQPAVLDWINSLESAADFEAALPLTLPQLSKTNYARAMDSLMSQLDGAMEIALIRTVQADVPGATSARVDIVRRLTSRPSFSTLGAGQQGNAELLWQAVNRVAKEWITVQGATPVSGAQWIEGLPYRSADDRNVLVSTFHRQWAAVDRQSADQWARKMGVNVTR